MSEPTDRSQQTRYYLAIALLAPTVAMIVVLLYQTHLESQICETLEAARRDQVKAIMLEAQEKREQASRLLSQAEALIESIPAQSAPSQPAEPGNAEPSNAEPSK